MTSWIEQGIDRIPAQMRRHPVIGCQAIGERDVLGPRRLRCFIHDVVRVLSSDGLAQFQHDGFGADHATGQVEVGTHPLGIEAQSASDQKDALQCFADEYLASRDRFERDAGSVIRFVFTLNSFQGQRHQRPDFR
jgi:hypothetical protein